MTPNDEAGDERHELCSSTWVDQVRATIESLLTGIDLSGVNTSFSEEFTDPPGHLRAPGSVTVGWHYRIVDGTLSVDAWPLHDADVRLVGDYATIAELARLPTSDPEFGPLTQAALDTGTLQYEGTATGGPQVGKALKHLHDDLVAITA